jgi:hypothetical protein
MASLSKFCDRPLPSLGNISSFPISVAARETETKLVTANTRWRYFLSDQKMRLKKDNLAPISNNTRIENNTLNNIQDMPTCLPK